MKTPTKEQIDKITRKLVKRRVKLLKSCCFSTEEIRNRVSVVDVNSYVEDTITEWEKLRKDYKRVYCAAATAELETLLEADK